jgi:hypothetical protein
MPAILAHPVRPSGRIMFVNDQERPGPEPASTADAGRYTLLGEIGSGGMGRVWRARDELLARDVAIKEIVLPDWMSPAERADAQSRAREEARTAAQLNHPNVVRIYDFLPTGGAPWIVMEYIEGRSLHETIVSDGPLGPEQTARLGLSVLSALAAAHRAKVLHRDVKPENVLVATDGRVVLGDFGLAVMQGAEGEVARSGPIVASPQYVAPERARAGVSTVEADLWSFGATLYAAVEGRSPYARSSVPATLLALATQPPAPTRRAGALAPVLDGLLRRNPQQRITAAEAMRLLTPLAGGPARSRPVRMGASGPIVGVATMRRARVPGPRRPGSGPRRSPTAPLTEPPPDAPLSMPDSAVPAEAGPEPAVPESSAGPVEAVPVEAVPVQAVPVQAVPVERAAGPAEQPPVRVAGPVTVPAPRRVVPLSEMIQAARAERPRRRRRGLRSLVALATLGLVGALATAAAVDAHAPGPDTRPAVVPVSAGDHCADPSPAAQPVAGGEVGPYPLPTGWLWHRDPAGFQVAVPETWQRFTEDAAICFRDPDGRRTLAVDPSAAPAGAPVAVWEGEERRLLEAAALPGYAKITIAEIVFRQGGADWEYTWAPGGNLRLHTLRRLFATSPTQAFTITWMTSDQDWVENTPAFDMITTSFRPLD